MSEVKELNSREMESALDEYAGGLRDQERVMYRDGFVDSYDFTKKNTDAYWKQQLLIEVENAWRDGFWNGKAGFHTKSKEQWINKIKAKYNIQ